MSPKNDKYSEILFGPHQFYSVHPVLFDQICFYSVQFYPFALILSTSAQFGLYWSYYVHFGLIRSIQSTLAVFSPYQFYSVHFDPIPSILSTLVLFGLFCPLCSTLVLFGSFCQLWFYSVYSVHFSPIHYTMLLFSPLRSYSDHFGLIIATLLLSHINVATLVHFRMNKFN